MSDPEVPVATPAQAVVAHRSADALALAAGDASHERWPTDLLAERLGYLGLAPFVLGAFLAVIVREDAHPYVLLMLSSYAAVVLSFLGGIHWGIGMRAHATIHNHFVWGIVPSIVAWVAVMMPAYAGLVIDGVMLVICYAVDRRVYPEHGLSRWLTLRFRLTVIAALACFIGAART